MDFVVCIVPLYGESEVFCARPIFRYFVILFEYILQLLNIFFSLIFYHEVVDYQAKKVARVVCFHSPGYLALEISGFGEMFLE